MKTRTFVPSPAQRRALLVVSQFILIGLGYFAAFALRFDFGMPSAALGRFMETLPYLLLVRIAVSRQFHLERGYWRHVGLHDLMRLTVAATVGSVLFPAILFVVHQLHDIAASIFVLEWLLAITLMAGVRIAVRFGHERVHFVPGGLVQRAFIIGAGDAGEQLLRQILHDHRHLLNVVGLIDDDPAKRGESLHGVPIVGGADELRGLVKLHSVTQVLIAIPSATPDEIKRLVARSVEAGVEVKLLPPMRDLVVDDIQVSHMREVQIEDLLGREPITLNDDAVRPEITGKVILVTGAGGSIGSELARQVARYNPLQLILLERAESPLYYIHLELATAHPAVDVVPVLASVTNADRLQAVFEKYRPDTVFHAAAYKHVPMLEWNVIEGVWNNVIGTLRLAQCAARNGVSKFVNISTDKAVNPTSVLGVTKRIAERIVLDLSVLRTSETDFRVVRFGNVLGSDGSVVPLFKKQLAAGGPLTITHPEVRRYFMTIPEAVQLVLQAMALPEAAGRISLLEMGTQIRIVDLAEQLIRLAGMTPHTDVKIVYTGLRPGEKLEEELHGDDESPVPTTIDKIRIVERSPADGALLAARLRHLAGVTARRDEQALIRALTVLVPEYAPLHRDIGGHFTHNGSRSPRRPVRRERRVRLTAALPPSRRTGNGTNGNG